MRIPRDSHIGCGHCEERQLIIETLRAANAELESKLQKTDTKLQLATDIIARHVQRLQEQERELQEARTSLAQGRRYYDDACQHIAELESSLHACQQELKDLNVTFEAVRKEGDLSWEQLKACREELEKEKAK